MSTSIKMMILCNYLDWKVGIMFRRLSSFDKRKSGRRRDREDVEGGGGGGEGEGGA